MSDQSTVLGDVRRVTRGVIKGKPDRQFLSAGDEFQLSPGGAQRVPQLAKRVTRRVSGSPGGEATSHAAQSAAHQARKSPQTRPTKEAAVSGVV